MFFSPQTSNLFFGLTTESTPREKKKRRQVMPSVARRRHTFTNQPHPCFSRQNYSSYITTCWNLRCGDFFSRVYIRSKMAFTSLVADKISMNMISSIYVVRRLSTKTWVRKKRGLFILQYFSFVHQLVGSFFFVVSVAFWTSSGHRVLTVHPPEKCLSSSSIFAEFCVLTPSRAFGL